MSSSAASSSSRREIPAEPQRPSSSRVPLLALGCLLAAFIADVAYFSHQLPERVATHFNLQGEPNGWMTRTQHVKFTGIIGVAAPLFLVGLFALMRKMGGWGLNIPNKAYWLDPERRSGTFDFLLRHGIWFAGLVLVFHSAMFHAILSANLRTPAALRSGEIGLLTSVFLAGIAVWIITLFLRFRRPRS
jgi:uncharacterized membrane protein